MGRGERKQKRPQITGGKQEKWRKVRRKEKEGNGRGCRGKAKRRGRSKKRRPRREGAG